jgi:hypothetical protein
VDELAKEAANGVSSKRLSLPHFLRTSLPASASATKQAYQGKLKRRWEYTWEESDSDRSRRLEEIDNSFPFENELTNLPDLKLV